MERTLPEVISDNRFVERSLGKAVEKARYRISEEDSEAFKRDYEEIGRPEVGLATSSPSFFFIENRGR